MPSHSDAMLQISDVLINSILNYVLGSSKKLRGDINNVIYIENRRKYLFIFNKERRNRGDNMVYKFLIDNKNYLVFSAAQSLYAVVRLST